MIETPQPYVIQRPTPEFIDFAGVRLELGYDYGMVGGPEFKTEVIEVADSREQRNVLRHLPLGRWQLGDRNIAESAIDKLEEVSYLKKFHEDRKGAKQGFRFKDWADYRGFNQFIAFGDGVTNQWQMQKSYHAGDNVTYRPIQKPVVGTVDIIVDGVNVAVDLNHEWEVDHETGIISHPQPLAEGAILTANFEFDVPVWFESDEFPILLKFYDPSTKTQCYKLGNVFVVEERIPLIQPWKIEQQTEISEVLDLGIVYETYEKFQYSTSKLALNNGYTLRTSNRDDKRILFNYGDRKFNQAELDILLGYFWNARGKAGEFTIVDKGDQYIVRFNSDRLNIKFVAADDNDALFEVSGLKLQLKEKIIYKLPPYSFELETITINPQDPNDPVIANSNPTGGNNSSQAQSDNINQGSYSLSSYSSAIGFNSLPDTTITPSQARWQASKMFWEAGVLWLIIRSTGNTSQNINWLRRGALYRLNSVGNFDYISSDLKEFDMNGSGSPVFARVFKTPTGTSFFVRSSNTVPFGAGQPGNTNGLLRFEVKSDGSLFYDFLEDSIIPQLGVNPPRFNSVVAVFGDRVYCDIGSFNVNKNRELGEINGLTYVVGNFNSFGAGFPINSSSSTDNNIFRDTEPFAFYIEQASNRIIKIYRDRDNDLLEEYFRGGQNLNASFQSVGQGTDGSIMAKIYLGGTCPDNTCSSNFDSRITYEHAVFFSESYNAPIQKFFRTVRPPTSESTYKFLTGRNSTTWNFNSDKYGNALFIRGSEIIFYRNGDTFAINISSQLPVNLKTNDATTPYGFALFSNSGDLFQPSSNETLVFVQSS